MRFEERLNWYLQGSFTAEDATRASGVSEAAQRLMQKQKIFSPVPQAKPTAKRMLFRDTVMRLSIAGELNRNGIPLVPASKIIHADMFIKDFLMNDVDPFQIFWCGYDKETQSYIRRKLNADPDSLYDPKKPVRPHRSDRFIEVVNSKYVRTADCDFKFINVLGELTSDKSGFVAWDSSTWQHIIAGEKQQQNLIDDSGLWALASKTPTKADKKDAAFACSNPTSKISINAGMALRAGLRRLLFIDAAGLDSESVEKAV